MTAARPRVHSLKRGHPILAYGPADGRQLLVLQPLFEEMNRCRALIAALCRELAEQGVGCWLPDLPGLGESPVALETVGWADWRDAVRDAFLLAAEATGCEPATAAIRGGALLDGVASRRWRLSPVTGASLVTDLRRTALAGGGGLAGYPLPVPLRDALDAAVPAGGARTLRLSGDDRPCDAEVTGPALWRRSEPAGDRALARALAADIAGWL